MNILVFSTTHKTWNVTLLQLVDGFETELWALRMELEARGFVYSINFLDLKYFLR